MGRSAAPSAPPEVADEVELYARENGRHATLQWVPFVNAWEVRFTLRDNDPIKGLVRAGAREEQYESVLLQERNPKYPAPGETPYTSLDIWQMGPSGVRAFLEKGNTWSGRGEFSSHAEAATFAAESNRAKKERTRRDARNNAVDRAKDARRQVHKIPFHRVGVDLKGAK